MNRATTFIMGVFGGLAAVASWRYSRSRSTESVDYETRHIGDGIEVRQYPTVVVAETVAADEAAARRRLRHYLGGANSAESTIPATTPLRVQTEPVEVPTTAGGSASTDPVRVGTYLPPNYSPRTAPEPTDRSVLLTVETPRTVAVRSVPIYPPSGRVDRAKTRLLDAIEDTDFVAVGDPFVFNYDNSLLGSLTGRAEVGIEVA